jgi:shikimate O-hydroxycinnamoyltransferase
MHVTTRPDLEAHNLASFVVCWQHPSAPFVDREMAIKVDIKRRTVMRPASTTTVGSGGGKTTVPLTAFDRASTDAYVPIVFAWSAPVPDNEAIVEGLLATVARYPRLLGRMGVDELGRKCFVLNDAGVLVIEAEADGDLADALAHVDDVAEHVNGQPTLPGRR